MSNSKNKFFVHKISGKFAFTLAEVLITLAIIGIVAALTLPTLMADIQGKSNRSKFKKAISTLQQAGRMSLALNDFSFGDITVAHSADFELSPNEGEHSLSQILNTGLKDAAYLSRIHLHEGYTGGNPYSITINTLNGNTYGSYILVDGTIIGAGMGEPDSGGTYPFAPCTVAKGQSFNHFWIDAHNDYDPTPPCLGFIDINGPNGPNKEVACSDGVETTTKVEEPCVVKTKDITDIFPIAFHDATVEPASNAAMYVLRSAK